MIQMLCILIQVYNKTLIFHLTKGNFVMKIFNSNVRKLSLSIALIGTAMVGQTAWACEKPNVSGYKEVGCLSEGLAYVVSQDDKVGYVNSSGQLVVPVRYKYNRLSDHMNFSQGLALVINPNDGKRGFIDKTGNQVIAFDFYNLEPFKSHGFAYHGYGTASGLIDKSGKIIVPDKYYWVEIDENSPMLDAVKKVGKDFFSKAGKQYDGYGELKENRLYVYVNGKYGYIDKDAKEVISLIYQDAYDFSDGLASVKKDGKYGFIDTNGKTIIDFKYDWAGSFENGKAKVESNDDKTPSYFYIDKTGKVLTTRTSLADFRKKLEQGDDVYYQTADGSGKGMIFEIKGNLVQVQTKESQCSQRDYKGNCQNYIENQVGKWVKKSEVYPTNHFD